MVGRRSASNIYDDFNFGEEKCKKMKSLHQIHDHHKNEVFKQFDNIDVHETIEEEEEVMKPKPIGEVFKVSIEGDEKRNHFKAFEFDGFHFQLEDTVLVTPEDETEKPSVAIIKDIFETEDGSLIISGQRLYRPEEAEKEDGGTWTGSDPRELFYSRQVDEIYAYTIMHRCVVHLVPPSKQVPDRKVNPGFIVRKVYDYEHKSLRYLTDRDCEGAFRQWQLPRLCLSRT